MKLISHSFQNNQTIPARFTCDGEDVSPHLAWSDFPPETKSFALACIDPDAPSGKFVHWLVANIPTSVTELEENSGCPAGAVEIETDFGRPGWGSPCPPSGTHRYIFTVFALSCEQLTGLTRENFVAEARKHLLDSAELIGLYERKK